MNNEAFLYEWSNENTGMKYAGYHVGHEEDGYINSSTNEEFWKSYHNDKDNWTRTILDRGSKKQMISREHDYLKSVNAAANENYYNKHNGGIGEKFSNVIDFQQVEVIYNEIKNKSRDAVVRSVDDIYDLPRKQVRGFTITNDKVKAIEERIKANTQDQNNNMISPIVIVTNREEGDILLDGNHTIKALFKQKFQEAHVIYIDFVADLDSNDNNMTQLGVLLNKVEDVSTDNSDEDIRRCIAEYIQDGVDVDAEDFRKMFSKQTGRSRSSISGTIQHVKRFIETPENWKIYDSQELNETVEAIKSKRDGVAVVAGVSDKVNDRIGQMVREMAEMNTRQGILVLYHSRPASERKYNPQAFHQVFDHLDVSVKIHVLETFDI